MRCPCGSGNSYTECCKPFHDGVLPENALKLMRSRYSAYALNLPAYIIKTTHPASPQFKPDQRRWLKAIADFSTHTVFNKLEVLEFHENGDFAIVTFAAHLTQDESDASFVEKSYFEKHQGKWFYRSGQISEGHEPTLLTTSPLRIIPLAYYGAPILLKVADPVAHIDASLLQLIDEMVETMDASNGIGLAAPQVHHSIKLFIIREPEEDDDGHVEFNGVKVFINPVVSEPSKETWKMSEGCLSIPTIHVDVIRPKEVTVEYTTLEGKRVTERVRGWQARMVQHENDHLNGVLFIDHLARAERRRLEPFLQHLRGRIHDGTEL